jgi:prepilin-type N-terminal cleavage/methylation domain-containing protein
MTCRRSCTSAARSGWTLIELLVVIAIVAILVGLLLPAVQKVREAAGRMACQNNLKQIALATHHYHDQQGRIPANPWNYDWTRLNQPAATRDSWSWMARLLPYLEQENVYLTGNIPTLDLVNSSALATPVTIFFCPSDTARSMKADTVRANLEGVFTALSNYKGVSGGNWCWGTYNNDGPTGNCDGLFNGDGMFFLNNQQRSRRMLDIADGTSNTIMVGEDLPLQNYHCSWPYSNNATGTAAIPMNVRRSDGTDYQPGDWYHVYSFRSRHHGGGNFAKADGSVGFIRDTIPLTVYRAMATISGGESVTAD